MLLNFLNQPGDKASHWCKQVFIFRPAVILGFHLLLALSQTSGCSHSPPADQTTSLNKLNRPEQTRLQSAKNSSNLANAIHRAGWGPNELMTYAIKILGIEAGRAAIWVGPAYASGKIHAGNIQLRGGSETVPFLSIIFRMREEVATNIALMGLEPNESFSNRQASGKNRKIKTSFGPLIHQTIQRDTGIEQRHRRIPKPRFDPISALFLLRSIPLLDGGELRLLVLSGLALYKVGLRVTDRQRIYHKTQGWDTIRLEGSAQRVEDNGITLKEESSRKFTLWLTDNNARIPVKIIGDTDIGIIEANLSSYSPPHSVSEVKSSLRFHHE